MRCITLFAVVVSATVIYGDDPLCHEQLVRALPASQLSSSDNRGGAGLYTGPERGRLNTTEVTASNGTTLEGAWSPAGGSDNGYLQAIFNDVTMIDSILTQGRNNANEYVSRYAVEYTEDGTTWKQLINPVLGVEQIFMGNTDGDTIHENKLDCPIFAKGIRIFPRDHQGQAALRFDVKGCDLDDTGITLTTLPSVATSPTTPRTTIVTTKKRTTPTTRATTTTTPRPTITTSYIFHPGIPPNLLPVTGYTLATTARTIPPPFMPGIMNPFGTTAKTQPFNPGSGIVGK